MVRWLAFRTNFDQPLGRDIPVYRALEAVLIAEFWPVAPGSRPWFVEKAVGRGSVAADFQCIATGRTMDDGDASR